MDAASPTSPSPSTRTLTYVRATRRRRGLRARRGARGARARRGRRGRSSASGRASSSAPLRAAVRRSSPAASTASRATPPAADFVTADDGTGIVHIAPAFGEDDYRLGAAARASTVVNPVKPDGTFDERIGPYAGRWVKDADPDLIEDLRARGLLLRARDYQHAYPFCWRCGTPLLYYAKPSWYIRTTQLRDRLLAANETGQLAPRAHQARPLRQLAGEQRRLGALARALLGHAAAGLALRGRPRARASARFAELERALGLRARGPAPPVRRRADVAVRRVRRADARACPR